MISRLTLWQRLVRNLIFGTPKTNRRKEKARTSSLAQVEFLEDRTLLAATVINVDVFADVVDAGDGVISLREAVLQANSTAGDFEIVLAAGAYTLTTMGAGEDAAVTGDLDILNNGRVSIAGDGAELTTITAAGLGDRVFDVFSGAALTLDGLKITGGSGVSEGAGIRNRGGSVEIRGTILSGNSAGSGGGIYNSNSNSVVTISNSTLAENSAGFGGGIYNILAGSVDITDSTLASNSAGTSGGGILNTRSGSVVTITSSTLSGNSASSNAGGIFNLNSGSVVINNSTLSGNRADDDGDGIGVGGGILNDDFGSTVTVSGSTLSNNSAKTGGGIQNTGSATINITASTFSGNAATSNGGGINNTGSGSMVTVADSSLSVNSAGLGGGGIYNQNSGSVQISNTTIAGNLANFGGGIQNTGSATINITASTFSGNVARGSGSHGGAITNAGSGSVVTISNSTLFDNRAGNGGGAIRNTASGSVFITGSTLSGNRVNNGPAGGISNRDGSVFITGSTLSGNSASTQGGAIANTLSGSVEIINSSLSDNSAHGSGGGIYNAHSRSVVTITDSTLSGNSTNLFGGGIINLSSGRVDITGSTLFGNAARNGNGGGGIFNQNSGSLVTVTNSTLSGNSADWFGGGIFNRIGASVEISNSTLTGNRADANDSGGGSGGGLYNDADSLPIVLHNTIIAGNLRGTGNAPDEIGGALSSASSFNLIADAESAGGLSHGNNGNILGDGNGNPILVASILNTTLADNGGPTLTHALVAGSPAINAGDPSFDDTNLPYDQRGAGFARVVGSAVDIGAIELQNQPPTANAGGPYSVDESANLTLDATASSDPDEGNSTLAFEWDLNYDGLTFDVDATGETPTVSFADNFATRTIALRVTDSAGESDIATTTLTVDNVAPTANDATETTHEDAGSFSLNANTLVSDVGATDVLMITGIVQNSGRTINFDGTGGVLSFDTNQFNDLAVGESETLVFTYTVDDQEGQANSTSTGTLTITVEGRNDQPTVTAPVTATATEDDTNFVVDLLAGASDPDASDVLHVSGLTHESGDASGVIGFTASGTGLSINPSAYNHLAVGETEVISYSYLVGDGNGVTSHGGTVSQTATITITGVNDTPTVTAAISATATEDDTNFVVDLLAGASDPDASDVLSMNGLTLISGDASGVVGITANGTGLDINPSAYNHLAVGEQEVITYSYNAIDSNGGSVAQTVTVTITGENDQPTAHAGGAYTVAEGSSITLDATGSSDLEEANTGLNFEWDLDYDGTTFNVDATGEQPAVNFADNFSTRTIALRVADSEGESDLATTTLAVENVSPTASIIGPTSGVRNTKLDFQVAASDPSLIDDAADFTYFIDWGDGSDPDNDGVIGETVIGSNLVDLQHAYGPTGKGPWPFVVSVTATDKDGATSAVETYTIEIVAWEHDEQGNLTAGVEPGGGLSATKSSIILEFFDADGNIVEQITFDESVVTGSLIIYGSSGNDELVVDSALTLPVELYGGEGDDILVGGGGTNLIVGGDGNDTLIGGTGTNTLDGGEGDDVLQDGGGTNTIIGGTGSNTFIDGGGTNTFEAATGTTTDDADPPQLVIPPQASGDEGSAISLPIWAGLSDTDGSETLTLTIAGLPDFATLSAGQRDTNGNWVLTTSDPALDLSGLTAAFADNGTYTLTVTATETANGTTSSIVGAVSVTVQNVEPQDVAIAGPATAVRGQTRYFDGSFSDPGSEDTHTLSWQAIDPAGVLVASGSGAEFGFIPTGIGDYLVDFSVVDDDGGQTTISRTLSVTAVAMQGADLVVGGTTGHDEIAFSPGANVGEIEVIVNGASLGVFQPSGRLVAFGQDGNDDITVDGSISLAAWLYGDAGDDRLKGGAGHDVLLGGIGNDLLVGGSGRDLLVGGLGADRIVGNADDDILIAGFTAFDYTPTGLLNRYHYEAIQAIIDEWTRTDLTQLEQIANLQNGGGLNGDWKLNGETVGNDTDADLLTGSQGDDWFLFDSDLDRATDRQGRSVRERYGLYPVVSTIEVSSPTVNSPARSYWSDLDRIMTNDIFNMINEM